MDITFASKKGNHAVILPPQEDPLVSEEDDAVPAENSEFLTSMRLVRAAPDEYVSGEFLETRQPLLWCMQGRRRLAGLITATVILLAVGLTAFQAGSHFAKASVAKGVGLQIATMMTPPPPAMTPCATGGKGNEWNYTAPHDPGAWGTGQGYPDGKAANGGQIDPITGTEEPRVLYNRHAEGFENTWLNGLYIRVDGHFESEQAMVYKDDEANGDFWKFVSIAKKEEALALAPKTFFLLNKRGICVNVYINGLMKYGNPGCSGEENKFTQIDTEDGDGSFYLKNVNTGQCMHTDGNFAQNDMKMMFRDGCEGEKNKFMKVYTYDGDGTFYIKNKQSGKCIHTQKAVAVPGGELVYHDGCDQSKNKFISLDFFARTRCDIDSYWIGSCNEWGDRTSRGPYIEEWVDGRPVHSEGSIHKLDQSSRYGGWYDPPGDSNDWFDDFMRLGVKGWGIESIEVHSGARIGKLIVKYRGGGEVVHGAGGGGTHTNLPFLLDEGECITRIKMAGLRRLCQLQFFTNSWRKTPMYGGDNNCGGQEHDGAIHHRYEIEAPANACLMSFKGLAAENRGDGEVTSLGFRWEKPGSCTTFRDVTGQWVADIYNNGGFTRELEVGTVSETSRTKEKSWGSEVSIAVEQGYKAFGQKGSVSVTNTFSKSESESYTETFSKSKTEMVSMSFATGGQLWKWVFTVVDTCGTTRIMKDYVMTRSAAEPPCCTVGWAADPYTQFGPCAAGAPNLCTDEQKASPNYGVQMQDSDVLDLNFFKK